MEKMVNIIICLKNSSSQYSKLLLVFELTTGSGNMFQWSAILNTEASANVLQFLPIRFIPLPRYCQDFSNNLSSLCCRTFLVSYKLDQVSLNPLICRENMSNRCNSIVV